MRRRLLISLTAALALLTGCTSTNPGDPETASTATDPEPVVSLELVTDELPAPREVIDVDGTLLVSDQHGTISVIEGGVLRDEPFLDLTDQVRRPGRQALELGLAGFQLAPDFQTSGTFYTLTTREPADDAPEGATRMDTVTAWTADPATMVADPGSAVVIIEIPQHGADHVGDLAIDADGVLWVGAGSPGPTAPAQDPEEWPGSLLRIVPDPSGGYSIPEDNPFVDGGGAPEVFSFGYRNIWRSTVDPELGVLMVEALANDSDQHVWQPAAGDNGGYPVRNRVSKTCWDGTEPVAECLEVEGEPMAMPVLEYGPEVGRIVSGVVVLRGEQYGDLEGNALVSDWDGSLLLVTPGEPPWESVELDHAEEFARDAYLWDMSVGADGTVYVSTTDSRLDSGALWRLVLED